MRAFPRVTLGSVLRTHIDAIPSTRLEVVNLAGVYGFGRGLFARGSILPRDTTYKVFHRLNSGDFVISSPKAWEGAIARISDEFDGWFLSPVFPTFRADPEQLSTRYLDWYCRREAVWRQLQGKARGMGARRDSVSPGQFLSLEIPLPTLREQEAIVARFEALAERSRQMLANLEDIHKASSNLLLSLHHKLAKGRTVRLGDVLDLFELVTPISATRSYPQVGVRGFGGGLFSKAAVSGTETTYRTFNRLYAGAVVLSQVKGWEGAIAVCPNDLDGWFVSPEYRTFRCKPGLACSEYFAGLVKTEWFRARLQQVTRGVGARRERTRPDQFLDLQLPMPELDYQHKVVEILHRLSALDVRHSAIREANAALLPAALERVFAS